jgi:hypothetical protein
MKNNTPKIYFTLTNTKKHRSVLAILALIVSLLLPAFAVTELPKDTNAITELTPDQAQKLVQEFPGVNIFLKTDLAEVEANGCLPLNGLKSLDSKVAQALAGFEKGPLLLNGLTTLTPESAHAIGKFRWEVAIPLSVLPILDAPGAQNETPSAPTNSSTLKPFGFPWLFLDGLNTLDAASATGLANFAGEYLSLNGLTTLNPETAKALSNFRTGCLSLNGIKYLTA